jgi:hypothetical protein
MIITAFHHLAVDVDDDGRGQFRGKWISYSSGVLFRSFSTCFRCGNDFGHHHHARRKRKGIVYVIEILY